VRRWRKLVSTDDEVDDWEELMPNQDRGRLSPVYDSFEMALYADPDEFTLREGFISAYTLMFLPIIVGSGLMITIRISSGELTVDEIIATLEASRSSSMTLTEMFRTVDYTEIGMQLLSNGILIPICLGVSLMVKTVLKLLAGVRS